VLAAYDRFWLVASTVDSEPEWRWPALLAAVAADPLLPRLLAGMRGQAAAGIRQFGTVVTRPTVVRLVGARASVVDCQDASRSGVADARTGLPSSVGSPRTPVSAVLARDRRGVWRVSEARYLEGPC
jgi:hypothetical protein